MKNNLVYFLIIFLSIITVSCNEEAEEFLDSNNISDEFKLKVASFYGVASESIKINNNFLIIGGDVLIPIEHLDESLMENEYQSRSTYYFDQGSGKVTRNTVIINVDPSFSSEWKDAFIYAVQKWNDLDLELDFSYTSKSYSVNNGVNVSRVNFNDIPLLVENKLTEKIGAATFPYSGNPGSYLWINENKDSDLSFSKKKYTAMHEIGHTIGFFHTNDEDSDKVGVENIYYNFWCQEKSSIMYKNVQSRTTFSDCDDIAFEKVY